MDIEAQHRMIKKLHENLEIADKDYECAAAAVREARNQLSKALDKLTSATLNRDQCSRLLISTLESRLEESE